MRHTWTFMRRFAPGALIAGAALVGVARFDHAFASDPGDAGVASPTPTNMGSCRNPSVVVGPAVETGFGPVRVEARVDGDCLCSVRAVAYPDGDPMSSRISEKAIPLLDASATAKGTSFDAVSGATYTARAYRSSLQAIIDKL